MGKWETNYHSLQAQGMDVDEQSAGTHWVDCFIPSWVTLLATCSTWAVALVQYIALCA